jgi:type IX secretion system PorP/SprF family membrane protein
VVSHLTQPQNDFYEQSLQRKYTLHLGYEFHPGSGRRITDNSFSVAPSLIIQNQAGYYRFNYGTYINTKPLIAGTWFRHDLQHPNSLIFLLGLNQGNYRIGYSYDYSLSGFSDSTGGAHEISVLRNFGCGNRNMKYRIINCPTF